MIYDHIIIVTEDTFAIFNLLAVRQLNFCYTDVIFLGRSLFANLAFIRCCLNCTIGHVLGTSSKLLVPVIIVITLNTGVACVGGKNAVGDFGNALTCLGHHEVRLAFHALVFPVVKGATVCS